ncbi:MAG: flagellar M-ring protein FliF [Candidatus Margulisiibacteriota bacterium]|nr:MAG: flagellar M-ring protein FliF [Candidatus Margulisbacteria bacterium GWD2_39_127]PZM82022.1 MAG: flagellar M-ring protein FliF [Candidatus Margulisiibacteriota bacterium]HCY35857.1 flagellar M-ring protein FliF [Candidatus Margulisiibacteriota bacterium]
MGEQENYEEPSSPSRLLGTRRNIFIIIIIALSVVLLIGFFSVTKKSANSRKVYKYADVFERLSNEEAAKLREELSFEGIHFKTKINGKYSIIEIREDEADEARIKMAQKGLPEGGVVGFEIFDKDSGLGVTDFDKRIKFIRAISGELSRNISRISSIDNARIQIVLPEEKIFSMKKPEVTASVLVQRKKGAIITVEQIRGIMHLCAASVESLKPENVAVIDMEGHILSEKVLDVGNGSNQKDAKQKSDEDSDENTGTIDNFEQASLTQTDELNSKDNLYNKESVATGNQVETKVINNSTTDYLMMKVNIEQDFTQKINKVLNKLYPVGSASLITSVELSSKSGSSIPRVSGINVLILIDSRSVNLTQSLKNITFKSVASVIGYKKNRDNIELRTTAFAKVTSDELNSKSVAKVFDSEKKNTKKKMEDSDKGKKLYNAKTTPLYEKKHSNNKETKFSNSSINRNSYNSVSSKKAKQKELIEKQFKYFNIKILGAILFVLALLVVISIIIKRKKESNNFYSKEFEASVFNSERNNKLDREAEGLEQNEEIDKIKNLVDEDPDKIAAVLKEWLNDEKS